VRATVCQIDPSDANLVGQLAALGEHVRAHGSELVLLPEMSFSPWLAAAPEPDAERWSDAVQAHELQIARLAELGAPNVLGTRPIVNDVGSRRNEAYLWTQASGEAVGVREKYYLPDEDGFWEHSWYDRGDRSFPTARAGAALVGVQICTEMWFLEWARRYGAARVDVLCVPRATPRGSTDKWIAGGRTAAVCSGAFCLSSNLSGPPGVGADCGGVGWIIDPDGEVIATTSDEEPFATVDIDLGIARHSKSTYPRYVRD